MYIMDLKVEGEGEKEYREYPVYGAAQVTALILKWRKGKFETEYQEYPVPLIDSADLLHQKIHLSCVKCEIMY